MESLNEALQKKELSITQKQGIITLIPKNNKPRELIQNWRPITLLNVDYKLLSGVFANRIKKVLPKLIGNDQKGFIKDRYIGENIRTVFDGVKYIKDKKMTGMLLLIDFEKAFDSLEWDYLKLILTAHNFGPEFISGFSTLYANSNSCVINNGFFTNFFDISRSCRQGDPLSPYLFILAVELLAGAIRNSHSIHGLRLSQTEIRISMYADDTYYFWMVPKTH